MTGGHHECELYLGKLSEPAESHQKWSACKKNPKHEKFIPVLYFVDNYLPQIQDAKAREELRAHIDRTVRLRVWYTSLDRPDADDLCSHRGTHKLRVGTGWIWYVSDPVYNKPCPCFGCGGKLTRKHWRFSICTACHVVFNEEEAKETKVDLFYDDEDSQKNGRMKSIWGLKVVRSDPVVDFCRIECVTCDKDLVERLKHAFTNTFLPAWPLKGNLFDLGFLTSCHEDCDPALIISHPHGQPKQVTVGELKRRGEIYLNQYTTPTCPGCSGAPVLVCGKEDFCDWYISVHSGSFGEISTEHSDRPKSSLLKRLFNKCWGQKMTTPPQQVNYGHDWW